MGAPVVSAHCGSKADVIGLVQTAAKEKQHIIVDFISPVKPIFCDRVRYHLTNRLGPVNILLFTGGDPEDVKRGLQKTTKRRQAEPWRLQL